ncbi:MAG: hypothetical protein V7629_03270 [Motiliproteus sp.]
MPPSSRGSPYLRGWFRALLLLLVLLPASSWARQSLLLVLSQDSPPYHELSSALLQRLPLERWQLSSVLADQYSPTAVQADLVVTVGAQATREVLHGPLSWPVLSVLIPRQTFNSLSSQPALLSRRERGLLSAIYLEQPVARQLRLAQLISPSIKRMGVVLGPNSDDQLPAIASALDAMAWQQRLAQFRYNENPIRLLEPLSESSDAILVLPDKAEFNRSISKWLLLLCYRRNIPLIGFSSRYVDAGATAAVFSTPVSIAKDAAAWLERWYSQQAKRLPAPAYPLFFEIRTSLQAAQSIGLSLPSVAEIEAGMSRDGRL